MDGSQEKLRIWQDKAEEYRSIAANCRHPFSRRSFLRLADEYERRSQDMSKMLQRSREPSPV
jgi:hypothetical protein